MLNVRVESGFKDEIMIFIDKEKINYHGDLYLTELGYFPNAEHHYRQRKGGADEYILIKCLSGVGYIMIDKVKHRIEENRIVIIPKGVAHMYWADDNDPWSIHWIHFGGKYIIEHYPKLKDFIHMKMYRNQSTAITSAFITLIDNLNISTEDRVIDHSLMTMKYILSTIFVDIVFSGFPKENHVENAITFMKTNIFSNVTLSDIAQECNISKSQLSLLFSKEKQSSPINFFLNMKIDLAVKYLILTDMSVKEISFRLGFKDQYYFSRLFKNIKGSSPLQYKKTHIEI